MRHLPPALAPAPIIILSLLLAACGAGTPAGAPREAPAAAPPPTGSGAVPPGRAAAPAAAVPPSRLANTVWHVTAPTDTPLGSLYIFLSDGTLMMTSCVETYRLAQWRPVGDGRRITIAEDRTVSYQAEFEETDARHLALHLLLRDERRSLTLEAAAVPFVCPDLRR